MLRNLLMLSLMAVLAQAGAAQEEKKPAQRPERGQFQFGRAGGPVISTELAEKLKLTADQKDKIAKLQAEFDKKSEESRAKLQEALKNKDRDAIRAASDPKAREELTAKVKEVLNDEQKKAFDEQRAQRRPGAAGGFGGRGGQPGTVLSTGIQDRLELTAEQKEKLAQLQKEVDGKLGSILTADQKKKLEEMKTAAPLGRRPQPQ